MTGTFVNTAAVAAGGCIGLLLKRGLSERMEKTVTAMLGVAACVIGANGLITTMISTDPATGRLSSSGELLLLVCLAVGSVIGEALGIEEWLGGLGERIEKRLHAGDFSRGFISASILFCVGAMTSIGSLNEGLYGDSSVLLVKSALDFIAAIILASTLGWGVLFAAATVLVYQGALTLSAGLLAPVLTGVLRDNICMVGYAVVLCIGINFFGVVRIRTANLLPALLLPALVPVWESLVQWLFA